jgi:serine/threonine-protein kinase
VTPASGNARGDDADALRILRDALDAEPNERHAFVAARCGGNAALRERVIALLARIGGDTDFDDDGAREHDRRDETDLLIGTRVGAFRIAERVGRGGMGVVYRATREHSDFAQDVAIKLIRRGFDFDDIRARFLRERRILARLSHPNLARFIDGGVAADGRPWFALEFVRGAPITRWCDAQRLDVRARVRLFIEVCAAVQYAHTQLVVHRDLKPGNVFVDDNGAPRLLDFGVAGLLADDGDDGSDPTTIASRRAVTPEYAAPEQFGGEGAGVASDVYALGVILYELVAGALPYDVERNDRAAAARSARDMLPQPLATAIARGGAATTDQRIDARHTNVRAYRALVRGDLSRIIEKALAKEPSRRYATVQAFADDLSRWLAGAPVRVAGNGLAYRARKFALRNRVAVGVAGALTLALIASAALAMHAAWREKEQRDAALAEVARSNAVVDYVSLMFHDAGQRKDAESISAREVLRSGASQIASRFAGEPETGQRVALKLAGLYARIGDTEGATPLLEQVLAWPGIDANPDVKADAQAQLAEVEYFRSHVARAHELLDDAQAFWKRDATRYARQLNESEITRSQIERAEGHADRSIATLEHAIGERRALLGQADFSLGIGLVTLSVSLMQAGRYDDAWQRANEAMGVYRELGEEHSTAAITAFTNRGTAALYAGRLDDAERDLRAAIAERRALYGPSPELAQAENNLALTLEEQGRAEEAVSLFEDGLAMAIEHGGETTRYSLPLRANLAEAYVASGRVDEAEPLAEKAVEIATAHYAASNIFVGMAKRARAAVRIAQGRRDEARVDLDAATQAFTAMGRGGVKQLDAVGVLRKKLDDV